MKQQLQTHSMGKYKRPGIEFDLCSWLYHKYHSEFKQYKTAVGCHKLQSLKQQKLWSSICRTKFLLMHKKYCWCSIKYFEEVYTSFPNKNIKANICKCVKIDFRRKILKSIFSCKTKQYRNLYHSVLAVTIICRQLLLFIWWS